MTHRASLLPGIVLTFILGGCGGATTTGGGGGTLQVIPVLSFIAPSSTTAGSQSVNLSVFGSNFQNGAVVKWNDSSLTSTWLSANEMSAVIPVSDVASTGTASITVANPSPGGGTSGEKTFTISAQPVATTWMRPIPGIADAPDIVWDSVHGKLYVSIPPTDTVAPNTIIPIDPVTASAGTPIPAGKKPDRLALSSDSAYLWVGLDDDHTVQRFQLPGFTKDISFQLPLDSQGNPQNAIDLQAARVSPHTVAMVTEPLNGETGSGVYIYDDATPRPNYVPGSSFPGGALIDWIQWSQNDSTIYGSQSITPDAGGVATVNVTAAGASLGSYNGGQVGPARFIQYDKENGQLYSYGAAFNPTDGSQIGRFPVAFGERTCTADSSLGRYYCFFAIQENSVALFELWIYNLNNYALIDRVYFGASAGTPLSTITGSPNRLIRWGKAGLALITYTDFYRGNGGVYLIDGAAVNPNSASDFSSGTAPVHHTFMTSLAPNQVPAGNPDLDVTIKGENFTSSSSACWNCNFLQFQYLPTSYVSSQQLNVTVPASLIANSGQLPITVFDTNSNLFSSNSLSLVVTPVSAPGSGTKVNVLDLAGLAMAWDPVSSLLYVGTAEYDGTYPNSIVAVDGNTGSVVKSLEVSSNPDFVDISASGQYVYVAYAGATSMTQVPLPGLNTPLTWTLTNSQNSRVYWAGDMKAAPQSAHTTGVTLLNLESEPDETGGVVVYDDNVERPQFVEGFGSSTNIYDVVAWGSTDQVLTASCFFGCLSIAPFGLLYEIQVGPSGATLVAAGTTAFNQGEIHSDFGTGLIYSDDGNVADPKTQALVGSYNASGLVAPDSSLNKVFILGQTSAQAGTNNFTIASFDEKAFTFVSSITVPNVIGDPIQLVRYGNTGLALLTSNGGYGSPGLLYLIQDATFIAKSQAMAVPAFRMATSKKIIDFRWKRHNKVDFVRTLLEKTRELPSRSNR